MANYYNTKAPLYAIVFHSSQTQDKEYKPYLPAEEMPSTIFSTPHMFDLDLEPAIDVIRYSLFLPPTFADSIKLRFRDFKFLFDNSNKHDILLLPWPAVTNYDFRQFRTNNQPCHWFCPKDIIAHLRKFLNEIDLQQDITPYSKINEDLLREIWLKVYDLSTSSQLGPHNPPFCMDIKRKDIGLSLPQAFLMQRIANTTGHKFELPDETVSIDEALGFRTWVFSISAYMKLNHEPHNPDQVFKSELDRQRSTLKIPITISASGPPPSYRKFARMQDTESKSNQKSKVSDKIIEIMTTHNAIGRCGVAIQMPNIPNELYLRLDELEASCRASTIRPRKIWTLIKKLSKEGEFLFQGDTDFSILSCAKPLHIYSDFPVGVLIPPGASAPLHMCVPTVYHPLTPLTRALQFQLHRADKIDLSNGFSVLIAECLDPTDMIANLSWKGLNAVKDVVDQSSTPCSATLVRISSPQDLAKALKTDSYDILILSAHGNYSSDTMLASLIIGNNNTMRPLHNPVGSGVSVFQQIFCFGGARRRF